MGSEWRHDVKSDDRYSFRAGIQCWVFANGVSTETKCHTLGSNLITLPHERFTRADRMVKERDRKPRWR